MSDTNLRQGVRLIDLVMLGAGTAIGASIFSVLGPAAQVGGEGILISVMLAALPMILFGLVYAFMASALPRTAASFEWQRQFTHPLIAFAIVWLRILSNAVVMIVLARVLVSYLGKVITIPEKPVMLAFFAAVFVLNFLGVAIAARTQTILMLLLLVAFAVFVAAGVPSMQPQLFAHALVGGWTPIVAALPLMIQLFLGIETTTEVGEEVKDPKRLVPLGLALAVVLTVVVYVAIAFTALSLVGAEGLAKSDAPLLTAAEVALGPWATPLIVTAAALALSKSMNAVFLVFSRFLYAMGRAGVLPAVLGQIHPRFGTPHIATMVAFGRLLRGPLLALQPALPAAGGERADHDEVRRHLPGRLCRRRPPSRRPRPGAPALQPADRARPGGARDRRSHRHRRPGVRDRLEALRAAGRLAGDRARLLRRPGTPSANLAFAVEHSAS